MKVLFFVLFFPFLCLAQQINLDITIKDNDNRGIESASVVILDNDGNTIFYDYSNEFGFLKCFFETKKLKEVKIEITALGYKKKWFALTLLSEINYNLNFNLDANTEVLKEVVIESYQKVKLSQDTTFIKVDKFTNNTEQTLEDVLKKLPYITVQPDGSIKAHGKPIDKLLVEGDDVFDKNYKILSKNLDAKVLDEVQILDNFEDNPILKKLADSDKVAINIKFKKGFNNIWFGNATLGIGTEDRHKKSLNIGLLRKNIKLFYFGDLNNIGEKGSNQITENQESIDFSDSNQKIEKKTKSLFLIENNENTQFSSSQSLFNKAFSNSISISTKINEKIKIRSVSYFINDIQNQKSISFTQYNVNDNPISFTENAYYKNNKILSSSEMELKFYANEKNYFTNYTTYRNNPNDTSGNLLFNSTQINQNAKDKNESFYNHFEHTFEIADGTVLKNYFYFGYNQINQKTAVNSLLLNDFLNNLPNGNIIQNVNNKLMYYGLKSTLFIQKGSWKSNSTIQINNEQETLNSNLKNQEGLNYDDYKNQNSFKQFIFSLAEKIKYTLSREASISSNSNIANNHFNGKSFILINQNIDFEFLIKKAGRFKMSISYNSNLPESQLLTPNSQLITYRSFVKGNLDIITMGSTNYSISYATYNNVKRLSVNASIVYLNRNKNYLTSNTIDQNFNFSNYFPFYGGDMTVATLGLTNYFRKLKLATKIETNQNLMNNPISVNSTDIRTISNYNSTYKFSGTTYFKKICNFDFGVNYNFFQSVFNSNISKNETKDFFLNVNYSLKQTLTFEIKNNIYFLNNDHYKFFNASITFNPKKSRFSYLFLLNNLANENNFTTQTITDFSSYRTSINLVPRYYLVTVKYRF